jgi:hypothetical protein
MYDDHYALLARPDIDAVLIATVDRWHPPLSIIARMLGKMFIARSPGPFDRGAELSAPAPISARAY